MILKLGTVDVNWFSAYLEFSNRNGSLLFRSMEKTKSYKTEDKKSYWNLLRFKVCEKHFRVCGNKKYPKIDGTMYFL